VKRAVSFLTLTFFLFNQAASTEAAWSLQRSHLRAPSARDGAQKSSTVTDLRQELSGRDTAASNTTAAQDGGAKKVGLKGVVTLDRPMSVAEVKRDFFTGFTPTDHVQAIFPGENAWRRVEDPRTLPVYSHVRFVSREHRAGHKDETSSRIFRQEGEKFWVGETLLVQVVKIDETRPIVTLRLMEGEKQIVPDFSIGLAEGVKRSWYSRQSSTPIVAIGSDGNPYPFHIRFNFVNREREIPFVGFGITTNKMVRVDREEIRALKDRGILPPSRAKDGGKREEATSFTEDEVRGLLREVLHRDHPFRFVEGQDIPIRFEWTRNPKDPKSAHLVKILVSQSLFGEWTEVLREVFTRWVADREKLAPEVTSYYDNRFQIIEFALIDRSVAVSERPGTASDGGLKQFFGGRGSNPFGKPKTIGEVTRILEHDWSQWLHKKDPARHRWKVSIRRVSSASVDGTRASVTFDTTRNPSQAVIFLSDSVAFLNALPFIAAAVRENKQVPLAAAEFFGTRAKDGGAKKAAATADEEDIQRALIIAREAYSLTHGQEAVLSLYLSGDINLQDAAQNVSRMGPGVTVEEARIILISAWISAKHGLSKGFYGIRDVLRGVSPDTAVIALMDDPQKTLMNLEARRILEEAVVKAEAEGLSIHKSARDGGIKEAVDRIAFAVRQNYPELNKKQKEVRALLEEGFRGDRETAARAIIALSSQAKEKVELSVAQLRSTMDEAFPPFTMDVLRGRLSKVVGHHHPLRFEDRNGKTAVHFIWSGNPRRPASYRLQKIHISDKITDPIEALEAIVSEWKSGRNDSYRDNANGQYRGKFGALEELLFELKGSDVEPTPDEETPDEAAQDGGAKGPMRQSLFGRFRRSSPSDEPTVDGFIHLLEREWPKWLKKVDPDKGRWEGTIDRIAPNHPILNGHSVSVHFLPHRPSSLMASLAIVYISDSLPLSDAKDLLPLVIDAVKESEKAPPRAAEILENKLDQWRAAKDGGTNEEINRIVQEMGTTIMMRRYGSGTPLETYIGMGLFPRGDVTRIFEQFVQGGDRDTAAVALRRLVLTQPLPVLPDYQETPEQLLDRYLDRAAALRVATARVAPTEAPHQVHFAVRGLNLTNPALPGVAVQSEVWQTEGRTVAEALSALERDHPELRSHLRDEAGRLRGTIYLEGEIKTKDRTDIKPVLVTDLGMHIWEGAYLAFHPADQPAAEPSSERPETTALKERLLRLLGGHILTSVMLYEIDTGQLVPFATAMLAIHILSPNPEEFPEEIVGINANMTINEPAKGRLTREMKEPTYVAQGGLRLSLSDLMTARVTGVAPPTLGPKEGVYIDAKLVPQLLAKTPPPAPDSARDGALRQAQGDVPSDVILRRETSQSRDGGGKSALTRADLHDLVASTLGVSMSYRRQRNPEIEFEWKESEQGFAPTHIFIWFGLRGAEDPKALFEKVAAALKKEMKSRRITPLFKIRYTSLQQQLKILGRAQDGGDREKTERLERTLDRLVYHHGVFQGGEIRIVDQWVRSESKRSGIARERLVEQLEKRGFRARTSKEDGLVYAKEQEPASQDGGAKVAWGAISSEVMAQYERKEAPVVRVIYSNVLLDSPEFSARLALERDTLASFGTDVTGIRDVLILEGGFEENFFGNLNAAFSEPKVIALLGKRFTLSPFHFSLILDGRKVDRPQASRAIQEKFGKDVQIELIGPKEWTEVMEEHFKEAGISEILRVISGSEIPLAEDDPTTISRAIDPTASLTEFLRGKRGFVTHDAASLTADVQGAYFDYRTTIRGN